MTNKRKALHSDISLCSLITTKLREGAGGGGGRGDYWYFVVLVENVSGKQFNFLLRCFPLQEWYTLKEKKKTKKGPKNWLITEEKKWEKQNVNVIGYLHSSVTWLVWNSQNPLRFFFICVYTEYYFNLTEATTRIKKHNQFCWLYWNNEKVVTAVRIGIKINGDFWIILNFTGI